MDGRYDVSVRKTQNFESLFRVGTDMVKYSPTKINVHRYITDARIQIYVRPLPNFSTSNY